MTASRLYAGAGGAPVHFPEDLFPTDGFCGIHDDPQARVLLLKNDVQTAIVALELVMLPPDAIDAVKNTVWEITQTDTQNIWVHTTHAISTPHAPHAPMGMGGVPLEIPESERKALDKKLALYMTALLRAVAKAAETAVKAFRPAKMGIGTGTSYVNTNRDIETPHGWWIGFNPDGPSNHTATVLRFDGEDGGLIGSLISFGIKPCTIDNSEMDKGTRRISSDVPGVACKQLEERFGAPCLFTMSAAGDQVPLEQAWYDVVEPDGAIRKVDLGVRAGLEMAERLGMRMASDIAPILAGIPCVQDAPRIAVSSGRIGWPEKARTPMKLTRQAEYRERGKTSVDMLVMTVGEAALVGLKPEINTVTEAQLQAVSPYKTTLVISMVNGGQKYMPDSSAYENSTWEAQSAPFMPGAAEKWVQEAGALLERMYHNGS